MLGHNYLTDTFSEALQTVLEKSMRTFGDELYIKHTPILHQEGP